MKIIIILLLVAIVVSLFSGAIFLFRDRNGGERTARALTLRIGLSVVLFLLLLLGFQSGLLESRMPM
ncbi:MAG: twin transmembrane helix small protein [Betaproteobacteria bacterium]|nr:twin transmembrane helix small protein [Betaproteobacteria bacterium]